MTVQYLVIHLIFNKELGINQVGSITECEIWLWMGFLQHSTDKNTSIESIVNEQNQYQF